MSIPSETSVLSYCSIFILHTNTHLRKFVDNTYHLPYLPSKAVLTMIVKLKNFSCLFKGKSSSELNLIFM